MLDLKYVRLNRTEVERNVVNRKSRANVARILELDEQRSQRMAELERDRAELNAASKSKPDDATIQKLRDLGESIKVQEAELRQVEYDLQTESAWLPNLSSPDMPIGEGEPDNVELRVWLPEQGALESDLLGTNDELQYRSQLPVAQFESGVGRSHHLDVAEGLGIVDMPQAAKASGSRFAYLIGAAAQLENALVQLLSQKLIANGFLWVDPPLLVQERVLFGTSHFPEGRDQVYQIASDHVEEARELFLVGSSEPSLFAFGMDRVFSHEQLPLKMFAVTPCFRSEVGSWGKDVRGIKRVHQFTKLEMDVICPADQSEAIFSELLGYNQWLLEELKLTYRVINKCTGDAGYLATHKQYDVEVWMPSSQEFMETMTDTNATDYQARRLNIRTLASDGERQYAHTVNDTGAALGRLVAAIIDNYQQEDGTVIVPDALKPWMGGLDVILPNKLVGK